MRPSENTKQTEDLKKLQDEIVKLKNAAEIEKVKMEAVGKEPIKAEKDVEFYN